MTLVRRIGAGYGGILLLVVAMVIVAMVVLGPLRSSIKSYSDTALAEAEAASQIALTTAAMGTDALVGVVGGTEEGRAEAVAQLEVDKAAAIEALAAATAFEQANSENVAALENLRTLLDGYSERIDAALSVAAVQPDLALVRLTEEVVPLGKQLDAAAATYSEQKQVEAGAAAVGLSDKVNRLWLVMIIMAAVVIVGGAALAVTIPRTISKHLQAAVSGIDRSASEMLAVASQVAASAAQTAAATNETTATVEEVKQTAQLAHEKASQVAESSQNVAQVAETGRATVEETVTGIERMQGQMAVLAETINRLSDQTQAVGDIISTVNDIAEQSNLLSVNASIEAAKAGEQGKGFTVVAQEVKNLAEQSKQAVAQVRAILGEIQKAGTLAVQAAEQGRQAIEAGRQQSQESGDAIHALVDTANEAAQSAVQISASSRQQLAGMEQISQAIESINQAGVQAAAGTRQVEEEVQRLQDLAFNLKRLVDARATA